MNVPIICTSSNKDLVRFSHLCGVSITSSKPRKAATRDNVLYDRR